MSYDIGYGSEIAYSDTQNGSYTDIAKVREITHPSFEVNPVDRTHMTSASYAREFAAGLINAGELSLKILFEKTLITTLWGLRRVEKWWRMEFVLTGAETTQTNWKCAGFLMGLQHMNPLEDMMEAQIKIKLTGLPVFTEGT